MSTGMANENGVLDAGSNARDHDARRRRARSLADQMGAVPSWRLSAKHQANLAGHAELWFPDLPGLIAALSQHMSVFVMSRAANVALAREEQQRLAHDTVEAATELLKMIIIQGRRALKTALIAFLKDRKLEHFLRVPEPPRTPSPRSPRLLPPPDTIYGRRNEKHTLQAAISSDDFEPVVICGGGGFGKTTLALDVLHSELAQEKFGNRRFFVRCGGLTDARTFVDAISRDCGVDLLGHSNPLSEVVHFLLQRAALLVIDNLDTIWDSGSPHRTEIQDILRQLSTCAHLIITVRGLQIPRLAGRHVHRVIAKALKPGTAREVFLHHAPHAHSDPDLDSLVRILDCHPLAIVLVAQQVLDNAPLHDLLDEWQRVRLLVTGGHTRETNFEVSVRLSLDSGRMRQCPQAAQLLALLCVVPDGLSEDNVIRHLFGNWARPAVDALCGASLTFRAVDGRIRTFGPIRDVVRGRIRLPLEPQYLDSARRYFVKLATRGREIGCHTGREAIDCLRPESDTIEWALTSCVRDRLFDADFLEGLRGLANFQRCTGFGSTWLLEESERALERAGEARAAARLAAERVMVLSSRNVLPPAAALAERARRSFRAIGDIAGEADATSIAAHVSLKQHEDDRAVVLADQALTLHRRAGNARGEATSLRQKGIIANRRTDWKRAHDYFAASLKFWKETHDLHNEGACHHGIANALRSNGQHELALDRLVDAMSCYESAGEVLSRCYVVRDMGSIYLAKGEIDKGEETLCQALEQFTEMAILNGMATCRRELARSAKDTNRIPLAVQHFDAAAETFQQYDAESEAEEMYDEADACRTEADETLISPLRGSDEDVELARSTRTGAWLAEQHQEHEAAPNSKEGH